MRRPLDPCAGEPLRRFDFRLAAALTTACRCVWLALLSASALAQGKVWVVDAAAGPGSFATQLQPAIDAASAGDTIVVRAGNYATPAILDGKGLALVADSGANVVCGLLTVKGIASQSFAYLQGLRAKRITAENCTGTLWLEQCNIAAAGHSNALKFQNCANVVLNGCSAHGACGLGSFNAQAFPGLEVQGANLYASDCAFTGADGCQGFTSSMACAGAPGLSLFASSAWTANCTFVGGHAFGGAGTCLFLIAQGGDGVQASGGSLLRTLGCSAAGGYGLTCSGPETAPPIGGAPYEISADAQHVALPGAGCTWSVLSPVREFQSVQATLDAEPDALAFLALALGPEAVYFDAFQGPKLVQFPWFGVVLGNVSAAGTAQFSFPFGALPPGAEGQGFATQVAVLGSAGTLQVCGGSVLTVLDQAF